MKTITEIPAPTSPAHTPGPWTILPNTPHFVRAATAEGMQPVATVYHFDGELSANARLIASAPELLDALERISTAYDETLRHPIAAPLLQAIYAARAAIAKAKGGEK